MGTGGFPVGKVVIQLIHQLAEPDIALIQEVLRTDADIQPGLVGVLILLFRQAEQILIFRHLLHIAVQGHIPLLVLQNMADIRRRRQPCAGAETVTLPQGDLQRAIAAHRQARHIVILPLVGHIQEFPDDLGQFLGNVSIILLAVLHVCVETAGRRRHDHANTVLRGVTLNRSPSKPNGVVITKAVEQIEALVLIRLGVGLHADLTGSASLGNDHIHFCLHSQGFAVKFQIHECHWIALPYFVFRMVSL